MNIIVQSILADDSSSLLGTWSVPLQSVQEMSYLINHKTAVTRANLERKCMNSIQKVGPAFSNGSELAVILTRTDDETVRQLIFC